jgi:hypothetical protein
MEQTDMGNPGEVESEEGFLENKRKIGRNGTVTTCGIFRMTSLARSID